jgi:PfaB family protein
MEDGGSFLLWEPDEPDARPVATLALRSARLITLSADTAEDLLRQLDEVAAQLRECAPLDGIARTALARCHLMPEHRLGLALVAHTPYELLREVEQVRRGIARSAETGAEWKSPSGSCFTANPLGRDGVAFVFPGVASPYIGVGADLFGIAPQLIDRFDRLARGQASRYLHADEIYPRGPADEAAFYRDVVGLGECAISLSAVFAMLMRDVFGVSPRSALGYSFGEAAMPAALGVWPDPAVLASRLDASPTFRSRLQGPMHAIREYWSLSADVPVRWRSFTVRATPAEAFDALRPEPRVYLCIINSPDEVVIAGDEDGCARVLSRIGSPAVPMPIPLTMHSGPARSEYDELVRIHALEAAAIPGIALFSSSNYQPVSQDSASLAHAVADGYTKTVDFPRLVRRVYAEGVRVFVEVGGRRNCSTWIEKILRGRPHAAIPCDAQGMSGDLAILRAVARLFTHRVRLNLDVLSV